MLVVTKGCKIINTLAAVTAAVGVLVAAPGVWAAPGDEAPVRGGGVAGAGSGA